jgi:hypothetical protein
VDGGDDGGIDALYYDRAGKRLYFVQTKWHESGKGTIDQGEALKFINGFNAIVRDDALDGFNEKVRKRADEIFEAVRQTDTHFVMAVGHTGTQRLHTTVTREFQKVMDGMNDIDPNMVSLETYDQSRIYSAAMGLINRSNIEIDMVLLEWGRIQEPYLAYYGQVSLRDVAEWQKFGTPLFDQNLRRILPGTEVNERIRKTLQTEIEHFWYYNNGITILCESVEKERRGADRKDIGYFKCKGVAVINGAQSVGAVWDVLGHDKSRLQDPEETAGPTLHVRLIDLRNCPGGFGRSVTRATNTQNRILGRDFAAIDPVQSRLASELMADQIRYTFKSGDQAPPRNEGFDIAEATAALACATGDIAKAVQAKREVGLFWDDIDREDGLYRSLFNEKLEATHLWRAVRILLAVEEALKEFSTPDNVFRLYAVHGNRFIAQRVFQDPEIRQYRDPHREIEALQARAGRIAKMVLAQVSIYIASHIPNSYPQSIFKSAEKCRAIAEGLAVPQPTAEPQWSVAEQNTLPYGGGSSNDA